MKRYYTMRIPVRGKHPSVAHGATVIGGLHHDQGLPVGGVIIAKWVGDLLEIVIEIDTDKDAGITVDTGEDVTTLVVDHPVLVAPISGSTTAEGMRARKLAAEALGLNVALVQSDGEVRVQRPTKERDE